MTIISLGDHADDTFFEGDYLDSLPTQVAEARVEHLYPDEVRTFRNRQFQMLSHLQPHDPLITRAAVNVPAGELKMEGWRTMGVHQGAPLQIYESHLGRPQYRSIVAGRVTPLRAEPTQTYRDVEAAIRAPDVALTAEMEELPPEQPKPTNKLAMGAMAALAAWMLMR